MSLAQSIWLAFAAACVAILVMVGVEAVSLTQSDDILRANQALKVATNDLRGIYVNLREAETNQRGFLLTGDEARATLFELAAADFDRSLDRYRERVNRGDDGNPSHNQETADLAALGEIEALGDSAIERMRGTIQGWAMNEPALPHVARTVRETRKATARVQQLVGAMVTRNETLVARFEVLQTDWHRRSFLMIGASGIALLGLLAATSLRLGRRVGGSFTPLLEGTRRVGGGDFSYRIRVGRMDEVGRLSQSFNDMAAALEDAVRERAAAQRAREAALAELQGQGAAIELLSKMSNRLQTCLNFDEFGTVVGQYVPQILPEQPGGLYLMHDTGDAMGLHVSWGASATLAAECDKRDCWAMRRGHVHRVKSGSSDIRCAHVLELGDRGYRCMPLIAHGDPIGVLYLEDAPGQQDASGALEKRLEILIENLALAIANFRLRESLREQSIRDTVTGLLNRRFLDEALGAEFARARRADIPLSVVMFDVDHFKRVNDEHGHEAGDAVLQAVGATLRSLTRASDVICRYGGEEFCAILPGADLGHAAARAEAVRMAIAKVTLRRQGRSIGPVTVSAGVAQWRVEGESDQDVVRRADDALYEAKRAGRDRVVAAPSEPGALAPPA